MSDRWLKVIPDVIRNRIEHRPNLLRVLSNIAWLYGDRVLRMGVGLLVTVWVARYLGPDQFGLMSYAIYVWAGVFVALGVARGKWLLAENLQHIGYWYAGLAMIVNIVGNLILIPVYGAIGASFATVLAQVTTALIAPALFASTRISVIMLVRSLNPLRWVNLIYANIVHDRG